MATSGHRDHGLGDLIRLAAHGLLDGITGPPKLLVGALNGWGPMALACLTHEVLHR
jgi:hypothetical protein